MFETIRFAKDVGFALAKDFTKNNKGQSVGLSIVGLVSFIVFIIVLGKLAPQMYSALNETKQAATDYGDTASAGVVMLIALFLIIGIVLRALGVIR